jgi:hypothetical protein
MRFIPPTRPDARLTPGVLVIWVVCLALLLVGCDSITLGSSPTAASPTPVGPNATATPAPPTTTPPPPTQTTAPPTSTPAPRTLSGRVVDSYTGKPVSGARLTAAGATVSSGADGAFDLGVVPPGAALQAEAAGYAATSADTGSAPTLDVSLRPTTLHGRVTDASSGAGLHGVIVRLDLAPAAPPVVVTATATITAGAALPAVEGYAPNALLAQVTGTVTTEITATAVVSGAGGPPAPTASPTPAPAMPTPFANDQMILAVTDPDGNYSMDNVPAGAHLTFKLPGYKLTKVQVGQTSTQDMALQPFVAKALYLTANAATYDPLVKPIMDLADSTEINAIVLNIQDDSARVVYDTQVPLAVKSGAIDRILPNIKDVVADLHKHNLYVIARMVTFMQPAVAQANPNLAVLSKATGAPWKGGQLSQQRWLDPTNPEARKYPLALAREAVDLGFDEIQFDYIRFPSDPAPGEKWDNMTFSQPADDTTKSNYIRDFTTEAHNMLNQTDAFMSVDIFGYTVWPDQNGLPLNRVIGQVFESMVGQTDYICPMIYPSHFSAGEMGYPDPNAHPYEIIKQAGVYTSQRLAGQRARYRPWLQGFDWNHLQYDAHLYRLQIQAADETGAAGWMFWDPSNVYSGGGFLPNP